LEQLAWLWQIERLAVSSQSKVVLGLFLFLNLYIPIYIRPHLSAFFWRNAKFMFSRKIGKLQFSLLSQTKVIALLIFIIYKLSLCTKHFFTYRLIRRKLHHIGTYEFTLT